MFLFGTVGNSLTTTVICKRKSLQVVSNFLITSLAFADLFVGRCSRTHACITTYDHVSLKNSANDVFGRVYIIASLSRLAAIHRLVAPDISSVIGEVARGQVSLTIALIWMVALIVTFPPKFPGVSDKPFLAFFVGFVLPVTLIIAVTYYRIFKITSKSIREHRTNSHFAGKVVRLSFVAALEPRLCHYHDKRQTGIPEFRKKSAKLQVRSLL